MGRKKKNKTWEVFTFLFLLLITTTVLAGPIIGGFSIDAPILYLSAQPYSLYYHPGVAYDVNYGTSGSFVVGAGFTFPIPWMNFSQIPLMKNEYPIAIAVAKAESNFQNYSVSSAGAEGLMQFMPQTAKAFGVQNPYDPFESVQGALNYINKYENYFSSLKLALAAYNAGPGAVMKYKGVPPYPQTQAYVKKVMKYISKYATELVYPNIYARVGVFGEYHSSGKLIVGLSYPLPPGQIDMCPEVTFDSSGVNLSWIWRINVGNTHIAFEHAKTDQIEVSSQFGPFTAIVGNYTNGIAASGILNLWGNEIFGSISKAGEMRYGAAIRIFGLYLEGWHENGSYEFAVNGRW